MIIEDRGDKMLERIWSQIKMDWWEITNLGVVGYFHYVIDWGKYLLGISTYKPDLFAYSEIGMYLDNGEDR